MKTNTAGRSTRSGQVSTIIAVILGIVVVAGGTYFFLESRQPSEQTPVGEQPMASTTPPTPTPTPPAATPPPATQPTPPATTPPPAAKPTPPPPPAATPPPPVAAPAIKAWVQTTPVGTAAYQLSKSAATLEGYLDTNGVKTSYWFEYGTSDKFGTRTEFRERTTKGETKITDYVYPLKPGTKYWYRLNAQTAGGTTYGETLTFTTLK